MADPLVKDRHHTLTATALFLALTATFFLAGCDLMSPQYPKYTEEELRSRPTFEVADNNYLAMLTEIQAELSIIAPSLEWMPPDPDAEESFHYIEKERVFCDGYFDNLYAARAFYVLASDTPVPDTRWPAALAAVERIAGEHGFQTTRTMADSVPTYPQDSTTPTGTNTAVVHHDVSIFDPYGARLAFGSYLASSLWLTGGCFLPEEYWTLPPSHLGDDQRSRDASRSREASRSSQG